MLTSTGNFSLTTKRRLEMTSVALWTAITASVKGVFMCLAATIVVAAISVFTTGARADGSWCAMYGTVETNCGFYSFEQCQASVSGVGGFCGETPFHGTANGSRRYRRQ
jgi:tryptophanase